ncbi:DUF763 domain-containing protein [Olivibacter sitiensis]|uniref:DUF763 domain-containing protein n=1 Tax=Olivibacter sitiensis TaxID=376470 RepID=UPI00040E9FAC|nr:DUF763 domain-containing protein [Olivibacter sitiensis]
MKSGHADLPLHYGRVPKWLAERMALLGGAIVEAIVLEYGRKAFFSRLSDPFWFQSLGCVMGMDWHSSGITTSVMGALKRAVNERSKELGLYFCGGRGKQSLQTPQELRQVAMKTGIDGEAMVYNSRLAAKVDNTAIQDGFQLYLHHFVVSIDGDWTIVQQGMNEDLKLARRYHWHSAKVQSFTEEPHSFIYGKRRGPLLNLTDKAAKSTKQGMLEILKIDPREVMEDARKLVMPNRHDVRAEDVNLKRLGAILALAQEQQVADTESLLLLPGAGPRTIQSLALISEVIHGTPSRFDDPARYSMAHGGKDGHPFPVLTKVYDESIQHLQVAIEAAKLGFRDKSDALVNLAKAARSMERDFEVAKNGFDNYLKQERDNAWKHGGKTVFGDAKKPKDGEQLSLF